MNGVETPIAVLCCSERLCAHSVTPAHFLALRYCRSLLLCPLRTASPTLMETRTSTGSRPRAASSGRLFPPPIPTQPCRPRQLSPKKIPPPPPPPPRCGPARTLSPKTCRRCPRHLRRRSRWRPPFAIGRGGPRKPESVIPFPPFHLLLVPPFLPPSLPPALPSCS